MKRMICMLMLFCLCLTGCSATGDHLKEPVTFYYVRENYRKDMNPVIASELREASGHRDDLPYLLALYSMGPSKEELLSPFPRNTKIIPVARTENSIELSLTDSVLSLTDSDFTLASACIAMTCMELTGVQEVTVICSDRSISITKDNLLIYSEMLQSPQEETE